MRSPGTIEEDDYNAWDEELFPSADAEEPSASGDSGTHLTLSVADPTHGERLDKWLAQAVPRYSRAQLQRWIEAGVVTVNGVPAVIRHPVSSGDVVTLDIQPLPSESAFVAESGEIAIVYEDDHVLVVNKPAGLVVHPAAGNWSGTLLNRLLHYAPQQAALPRAGIVHRLDKETSGLMVVARSVIAQTNLVRQLQARTVKREYLAIVHGEPPASGTIDAPIGRDARERTRMAVLVTGAGSSKPAVTHYVTLQRCAAQERAHGALALVRCRLETGRTHQIRVHMQSIGHPLLGDPVYRARGARDSFARQALHAWRLGFVHPESGRDMHFAADPPSDVLELFRQFAFDTAFLRDDDSAS